MPQELAIERYYQMLQSKSQEVKKAYEEKQEEKGKSLKKEQEKIQTRIILLLMGYTEHEAEEIERTDDKSKAEHPDFKKWLNIIQSNRTKPFEEFVQILRAKSPPQQQPLLPEQEIVEFHETLKAIDQEIKETFQYQSNEIDETLKEQQEETQTIFIYRLMGYTEEKAKEIRKNRQKVYQLDKFKRALENYQKDAKLYRGYGNISEKYEKFITDISPAIEALGSEVRASIGLPDELEPYNWENPPTQLEQWFHHILCIPIQSEEDKRKHRIAKITEMLESLEFIREAAGIKTTVDLENYKNWLQQTIQGKATLLGEALRKLNMQAADEAINEFSRSLGPSPFNAMLVTKGPLGDIGHKRIESRVKTIEQALDNLPKEYFRKDGLLTLIKEARNLLQAFNSERLHKKWSIKEAKLTYEALIIKLREFTEKFKAMRISDLASKKQEKIYQLADSIHSISSKKEGDKIYKEFIVRSKKTLKELKKLPAKVFYAASFHDEVKDLLSEDLEEEKNETLKDLKEQLLDETRPTKKKELMFYNERQNILENPRRGPPHLVEQKIENSLKEEDKSKKAVYEFLIATFYEQLKEALDYPELSCLLSFTQVRNYFNHPNPYREPLIVNNAKHFEVGIHVNNPEGTIAKEMAILSLNIKFIFEEACKQLTPPEAQVNAISSAKMLDGISHRFQRKIGEQSSYNLQKSKKRIAGSHTGKDLMKGGTSNDSTEEKKKEKALGSTALNANTPSEEDTLTDNDYNNLNIKTKVDTHGLSIRNSPFNIVGRAEKTYKIDDKMFSLQNVSGESMRCFFNAAGLNAMEQIKRLRDNRNDSIVRYMIANEIVSAAANPNQLPKQVKEAINYTLYEAQRINLDNLEETRSKKLAAQNPEGNLQDPRALPMPLQNIGKKGEEILVELRKKAFSLKAFNAFLDYHIGSANMMVALYDVKGEIQDNNNANYTSIDAIAYVNKLGIKIYQPNGKKGLRLVHQFIRQGATEIVYLYHQGVHFQALVPK